VNLMNSQETNSQNAYAPPPVPSRPWDIIAQELSQETDEERILELLEELNQALNEQIDRMPRIVSVTSTQEPM